MVKYKGISFSEELNCSFEEFKEMFASNRFFKEIPSLERDAEMNKVWKSVMKANGNDIGTPTKSKNNKAGKSKKGFV